MLKNFAARKGGNIATSFALVLVPLMTVVGMAMDFSRSESSANQVQFALDGAVLAAARSQSEGENESTVKSDAQSYFDVAMKANSNNTSCGKVALSVSKVDYNIDAKVSCSLPTTLSGLIGIEKIQFKRQASTAYGVGKLDVVFMFDTSGSMKGDRIKDLKVAAKEAVKTILSADRKDKEDIRIAISTYANAVNVGEEYFEAVTDVEPNLSECTKWTIESTKNENKKNGKKGKKGKKDDDDDDSKGKKVCTEWKQVSATCVTGREGVHKYDDTAPGSGAWVAYDTLSCNSASITPLTWNQGHLVSAIETLPTSGSTAGHLGIIWSWYLISPNWASIWPSDSAPKAYDEPDTTKVAILMTDGAFNTDYMSNGNSFDHAKKYCDAMKQKNIQIFTVAFQAPKDGQAILKYCASTEGQFFAASSGQELTDAYKKIATSVSDLRISH